VKQITQGVDPLLQAGKLGAVLCQFPWSFKNNEISRKWLMTLFSTFKEYSLVVELRHASWDTPAIYEILDKQGVGFATIDQPVIGQSIKFKPILTGKIGYVRLHGRNYKTWFGKKGDESTKSKSPAARYDYLYSNDEITEIAKNVKAVSEGAEETYVIQNNHPWGQAVANAVQLKSVLGETDIKVPSTLLSRFPHLSEIAQPEEPEPEKES